MGQERDEGGAEEDRRGMREGEDRGGMREGEGQGRAGEG